MTAESVECPAWLKRRIPYRPRHMSNTTMGDGRSEVDVDADPHDWGNPVGNVHGGSARCSSTTPRGWRCLSVIGTGAPTVSLQVDYLHGCRSGVSTSPDGEVVHVGKATAIVDVHVYDADDVMVARGKCYFQLPSSWRDRNGPVGGVRLGLNRDPSGRAMRNCSSMMVCDGSSGSQTSVSSRPRSVIA